MNSQELDLAIALHKRGDLRQAEHIYRQILEHNANHADAWHLLGVIALQEQRHEQALELIRKAIQLQPTAALMHANLGVAYKALKRWDEAAACYRQALVLQPDYADAQYNLGRLLCEQGKRADAVAAFQQAIRLQPGHAEAHNSLGQTLREQGLLVEAIHALHQALKLRPNFAEAHVNLGNTLRDQNNTVEAVAHYEDALRCNPQLAEAHNNVGCVLRDQRGLEEAAARFRQALRIKPDFADAHKNLAVVLQDQGMLRLEQDQATEAQACFEHALEHDPAMAIAHNNLGTALFRQNMLTEAKASFEAAVRLQPSLAVAHSNLGRILASEGANDRARACFEQAVLHDDSMFSAHYNLGLLLSKEESKLDQAEVCFRRAVALEPNNPSGHEALAALLAGQGKWTESLASYACAEQIAPAAWRQLKAAMCLPIIPASVEQIQESRRHAQGSVARLLNGSPSISDPLGIGPLGFYLAYHGFNDRALRIDLAQVYLKANPDLATVAPHCRTPRHRKSERIKIGFVSAHLRNHTIGRLNAGLIQQLERTRFHVSVVRRERQDDEHARLINQAADQVLVSPDANSLDAARRLIAEQELDVIFYPDIGMEPWTYLLSFARLAPVQCVTWGHPLTTGVPAVDYFISSEDLDTEVAQGHYSEKLVRLKDLAVYYERPKLPVPGKSRADFGLPPNAHLYGCLQTLFKFHPEFDPILAEILRRDPEGIVLIIEPVVKHWKTLMLDRFNKSMPDVVERIRFVPPQYHQHYLCLVALCDVILDPIPFGGGNTSYEALGLGVPVVTLPTAFLRGRITQAQYRRMNMPDCVVANTAAYIDVAVRLGTDRSFQSAMSSKIQQSNQVLFDNGDGVRQLESFLLKAVTERDPA